MTTDNSTAPAQGLTDEELARIAYKGFDDYWTEDCAGKESEAWAASAKAVLNAALVAAPPELPAGYLQQRIDWERSQEDRSLLAAARRAAAPHTATPSPAWPEFTDTARAALLWVLWHHQGGSSKVGQPLRFALGMGAHDELTKQQVEEARRWGELHQAHTATPVVQPVVPADVRDALALGLGAAQEVAATLHRDMAGYRQARHDAVDADVRTIQAAIDSLPAAHIRRVGTLKISADGTATRAEIDPPHWWLQCMLGEHAVYVAAPASDADSMQGAPTSEASRDL